MFGFAYHHLSTYSPPIVISDLSVIHRPLAMRQSAITPNSTL